MVSLGHKIVQNVPAVICTEPEHSLVDLTPVKAPGHACRRSWRHPKGRGKRRVVGSIRASSSILSAVGYS
jgi:hypothetical protein